MLGLSACILRWWVLLLLLLPLLLFLLYGFVALCLL
jgi:hypothetical protein